MKTGKEDTKMNTEYIKGVIVPILTAIDEQEKVDDKKMRAHVDYVIEGGVSGILAFGSNGEFYMMEEDEMKRGLQIMVDQAAGRVPVYFGIGAISTKKAAVWQKWPWRTVPAASAFCNLCS